MSKEIENRDSRVGIWCQLGVLIIGIALIAGSLGYLVGATAPASAPPTVIDGEGLEAYKINGIRYANAGDVDSIQDSLDDMLFGGLLIIPSGDYAPLVPIEVPSNVAITGTGIGTRITWPAAVNGFNLLANTTNVTITNLYLEGGGAGSQHGISMTSCQYCTIDGVFLSNWGDDAAIMYGPYSYHNTIRDCIVSDGPEGIEVVGGYSNQLLNNRIHDITGEAIELRERNWGAPLDLRLQGVLVSGNEISGVTSGIWIYGNVSNARISNNIISDCSANGIYTSQTHSSSYPSLIDISGNTISDVAVGIRLMHANWRDIRAFGNMVSNFISYGFYVSAIGENLTVSQNIFWGGTGATSDGINIQYAVTRCAIEGNTIGEVGRHGMMLLNLDHIMVQNNHLWDTGSYGMQVRSGNSSFIGNSIYGFTTRGISLSTIADNCTVIANLITGGAYGVYGEVGVFGAILIGNNFRGCTTGNFTFSEAYIAYGNTPK